MRLSIIIPTRNRAALLLETIDSISPQLRDGVELVIVDASADYPNPAVASRVTPHIRHERGSANSFDAAYEEAVAAARGEWVWLFSDDDWFKPEAVSTVLAKLDAKLDLLIVNAEVREQSMERVLLPRWVKRPARDYEAGEFDRAFADLGDLGSFVGSVIIRRSVWLDRMPGARSYFGTRFLTFVIPFLQPTPTRFVNEILVSVRFGHQGWINTASQLIGQTMTDVVWSFPVADWSKAAVRPRRPGMKELLLWRAAGCDVSKFSRLIAAIPKPAAKFAVKLALRVTGKSGGISSYVLDHS
jgi:glycosyltransferase involved in cell wall biosynthesis